MIKKNIINNYMEGQDFRILVDGYKEDNLYYCPVCNKYMKPNSKYRHVETYKHFQNDYVRSLIFKQHFDNQP